MKPPIVEKKQYKVIEPGWYAGLYVGKGKRVALSDDEAKYLVRTGNIELYVDKDGEEPDPTLAPATVLAEDPPVVSKGVASDRSAEAVAATAVGGKPAR